MQAKEQVSWGQMLESGLDMLSLRFLDHVGIIGGREFRFFGQKTIYRFESHQHLGQYITSKSVS